MTFKEAELVVLVTAALIATVVRMFLYLLGGNEGTYLRNSIAEMGTTVILLEVCIVMLRFFTTFQVMSFLRPSRKYEMIQFAAIGMLITFTWTTLPVFLFGKVDMANNALMYISNRPFEPLPILVEYISLYLLHHRIINRNTFLTILCMSIISVVIALNDIHTAFDQKTNATLTTSEAEKML